jgi:hypothetical protein
VPVFHHEKLSGDDEDLIVKWLEVNGCRHWISVEHPVVLAGNVATYVAVCRKDPRSVARVPFVGDSFIMLGKKRARVRVPLADVRGSRPRS